MTEATQKMDKDNASQAQSDDRLSAPARLTTQYSRHASLGRRSSAFRSSKILKSGGNRPRRKDSHYGKAFSRRQSFRLRRDRIERRLLHWFTFELPKWSLYPIFNIGWKNGLFSNTIYKHLSTQWVLGLFLCFIYYRLHVEYDYFIQDDAYNFIFEIWGLVLGFLVGYRADKCLHSYTQGLKLVLDMDYHLKRTWKTFCFSVNRTAFHKRSSLATTLRREELAKDLSGFLIALMTLAFRDINKGHLVDHETLPQDIEDFYTDQLDKAIGTLKQRELAGQQGLFTDHLCKNSELDMQNLQRGKIIGRNTCCDNHDVRHLRVITYDIEFEDYKPPHIRYDVPSEEVFLLVQKSTARGVPRALGTRRGSVSKRQALEIGSFVQAYPLKFAQGVVFETNVVSGEQKHRVVFNDPTFSHEDCEICNEYVKPHPDDVAAAKREGDNHQKNSLKRFSFKLAKKIQPNVHRSYVNVETFPSRERGKSDEEISLRGKRVVAAHPRCSKNMPSLRCYVLLEWIEQVMKRFHEDGLLSDDSIAEMRSHVVSFEHAWIEAHDLSYIADPAPYVNLIQTSVTAFTFMCPIAFVDFFEHYTYLPFTLIFHTFLGLNTLATHMRNPFGIDPHDIKLSKHLVNFVKYVDEIKIASGMKHIVLHLPAAKTPAWLMSMNEDDVIELLKEKLGFKTARDIEFLEKGIREHRIHGSGLMQMNTNKVRLFIKAYKKRQEFIQLIARIPGTNSRSDLEMSCASAAVAKNRLKQNNSTHSKNSNGSRQKEASNPTTKGDQCDAPPVVHNEKGNATSGASTAYHTNAGHTHNSKKEGSASRLQLKPLTLHPVSSTVPVAPETTITGWLQKNGFDEPDACVLSEILKNNGYENLMELSDKNEGLHPKEMTGEEYNALGLTGLRARRKFKRALETLRSKKERKKKGSKKASNRGDDGD